MNKKLAKLLVVIFIVFLLLFHYPIITIANVSGHFNGIPAFFIYLFAAWTILVILLFVLVRKTEKQHDN